MPVERSYQWWECKHCGEKYFAISEDSHVNMFDDRIQHTGYVADKAVWATTLAWAGHCPDPQNTSCTCEVHQGVPPAGFIGASGMIKKVTGLINSLSINRTSLQARGRYQEAQ
jgi:hypothetical protein